MADQTDILIQSVIDAVKLLDQERNPPVYVYLKNVRVVVDDTAFPTICDQKLNVGSMSLMKTTYNPLKMVKTLYSKGENHLTSFTHMYNENKTEKMKMFNII